MIKKTIKAATILVGVLAVIIAGAFIYQGAASASEERSYAATNGKNESVVDDFTSKTDEETKEETTEEVTTEETTIEETTVAAVTTNTQTTTRTQTTASSPVAPAPTTAPTTAAPVQIVNTAPQAGVMLTDAQGKTLASQNSAKYAAQINEMYNIINQRRAENGLAPLQLDGTLIQVASFRAAEMAHLDNGTSQISHTRPNGQSFSSVAKIYGVGYSVIGENICDVLSSPASAMSGFMNSPGHKANILGNFTSVGIGVAQASDGTYYWAQIFKS